MLLLLKELSSTFLSGHQPVSVILLQTSLTGDHGCREFETWQQNTAADARGEDEEGWWWMGVIDPGGVQGRIEMGLFRMRQGVSRAPAPSARWILGLSGWAASRWAAPVSASSVVSKQSLSIFNRWNWDFYVTGMENCSQTVACPHPHNPVTWTYML